MATACGVVHMSNDQAQRARTVDIARARERTHRFSPFIHAGPLHALAPTCPGPNVPLSVERVSAARWRWWVPWVRMHLLRQRQSDPTVNPAIDSANSRCLRQRHREHILDLMRDGISMRSIRRHRLDDPRLTDEVRAMLVQAARERQSKAWFRRAEDQRAQDRLATAIRLGPRRQEGRTQGRQERMSRKVRTSSGGGL